MQHKIARRQALKLGMLGGLGAVAAACGARATPAPAATRVAASPTAASLLRPTTAPTAVPATATALPTTAPSAVPPTPVPPTAAPTATPQPALAADLAEAANRFLAALDEGQRAQAIYAFSDEAERTRWHWTTPRGFPRNGLPLKAMSAEQRDQALRLLETGLSPAGMQKALDIISLQVDLGNDPELYYVTVFGTPGGSEPWGWRFEGHHLSRHFTLAGDLVSEMPFFLGAWPTVNGNGLQAMEREEWAARELATALTSAGQSAAIFQANTLSRHVTGNAAAVSPLDPVGLAFGDLGADSQALVVEIIQTYLNTLPTHLAEAQLAKVAEAGVENVRFGWAGTLEPRRPHYYRLQGPSFLLEHDNSRNGGTHIHSVWRDFTDDFGRNLLG
jgi:hypothetical protein